VETTPWTQEPLLFQDAGHAWHPCRPDIVPLLEGAEHRDCRPIYYGSNHTFLVTLRSPGAGDSLAVYKPARGEYPLHDFPHGTLYRREIAAWVLDRLFGWSIVPPTVQTKGVYGVGSLQLFIEAMPEAEIEIERLRRMALFDVIANNADRKVDHCLPAPDGKLWGIDHGLTFHAQGKLRTVLWHFAGTRLTREERSDIERLLRTLSESGRDEVRQLRQLISGAEWRALCMRLERLLDTGAFPDPRYKPVPYRW
jgi:hypothetical protein